MLNSIQPSAGPTAELLAPAGDWTCARAAVANGADAVYFGLDCGFNARARAANFTLDELPGLLDLLHAHRVKGYVTLNTLAFPNELEGLEQLVRTIARAGADAVLVQDLGLVRLIRHTAPDLAIHASTQMTLTSAEGIQVAEQLGIQRVVVGRELSLREIVRIRGQTQMPLEVFVHGALCVAYSGQCLTSESLGGRSANRGQCAQACRLPYELICDGREVPLEDRPYLLSPQDLAAFRLVPELIQAGVAALKIEGRLKSPEYVANITRHYRMAIDQAVAGHPVAWSPRQVEEMELSFSRGFSHGWLEGCNHKTLVPGESSAKRGIRIGRVVRVRRGRVEVELCGRLKAGDGVAFQGNRAAGEEQGGRVFAVYRHDVRVEGTVEGERVELAFATGAIDVRRIHVGQTVWKNDDPALTRRWRKTYSGRLEGRVAAVEIRVWAAAGTPLRVAAQVDGCEAVECTSPGPLEVAIRHPLTQDLLVEQFGRLGGTGLQLARLSATIDGSPMVPLSVLGQMRRQLVTQLQQSLQESRLVPRRLADQTVLGQLCPQRGPAMAPNGGQLHVLCRSLEQLDGLLTLPVESLYADFQDIRQYGPATDAARSAGVQLWLATPRIHKPGEQGIFYAVARHRPDGILARNLAAIDYAARHNIPFVTDYSLNAANQLTVDYLRQLGARRVTASYDLNRDQLLDLAAAVPTGSLEVVVHQHMPLFHMEHCVFCAVLSPGTDKTNCGRPCDRHQVQLRDRVGVEHPLTADVGCRNTLYNAVAQSGAEVVEHLRQLGAHRFRIELLDALPAEEARRTVQLYRQLLDGRVSGRQVWRQLRAINQVGLTRGTLEHAQRPQATL